MVVNVNDSLREQLKSSQARLRHEAIVQLARAKDEDALPLLNEISKHDPEPSLRQLAERAINHILNEFSSTISRVQTEIPSDIPPFSNFEAEQHFQKAFQLKEQGANANALQYLIKALELSPDLMFDFDVQILAEALTGVNGAESAKLLTDPEKRRRFFTDKLDDDKKPPSGPLPNSPRSWIILALCLFTLGNLLLDDGMELINKALDDLEVQHLKQSMRTINGMDYFLVLPDTPPLAEGYPLLIALPDGKEDASAMLHHFAELSRKYGTILAVPDFRDYRFAWTQIHADNLHRIIADIQTSYPIDAQGAILFGYGDGATIASQYAGYFPENTAGVITSGGTYIYPPSHEIPFILMFGEKDPLLQGVSDGDISFADISEWTVPLNYLTIEQVGHEINTQQTDITAQFILEVYQ